MLIIRTGITIAITITTVSTTTIAIATANVIMVLHLELWNIYFRFCLRWMRKESDITICKLKNPHKLWHKTIWFLFMCNAICCKLFSPLPINYMKCFHPTKIQILAFFVLGNHRLHRNSDWKGTCTWILGISRVIRIKWINIFEGHLVFQKVKCYPSFF